MEMMTGRLAAVGSPLGYGTTWPKLGEVCDSASAPNTYLSITDSTECFNILKRYFDHC